MKSSFRVYWHKVSNKDYVKNINRANTVMCRNKYNVKNLMECVFGKNIKITKIVSCK